MLRVVSLELCSFALDEEKHSEWKMAEKDVVRITFNEIQSIADNSKQGKNFLVTLTNSV
jgi:hypothetical protein